MNAASSNVVWLSANELGLRLLSEARSAGHPVGAILTLSAEASTVMYDGVDPARWKSFGIPVYEIRRANDAASLVRELSPDLIVMCGWRQLLKGEILEIPRLGVIAFHPTLLPVGRGPAPLINTILHGFTESGVTLYYVSEGLDDGDVIAQSRFRVTDRDHAADLYDKVSRGAGELLRAYLPQVLAGTAPRIPQDESKATVFAKPSLAHNRLDPVRESLEEMDRKIRALSHPYRGAYLEQDGRRLRIWRAELEKR